MLKFITDRSAQSALPFADLIQHTHNKIVGSLGLVAMGLGLVANLRQYGVGAAALFLASSALAMFVLLSEISCVISGKCHKTALLNTLIATGIFMSVIWYYAVILFDGGSGLPTVKDQPIAKVDRAIIPVSGLVEDKVKGLVQQERMGRVE